MSLSASVAETGAPMFLPAGVFSGIVRVAVADGNTGASLTSVTSVTRIVTSVVASIAVSGSPRSSLPSLTDTKTE